MSLVLKLVLVQNDKQRRNISCIDISTISVSPYLKMVHFYRATMSLWAMLTACVWPNSLKEIPVWNTRVAVIYIFLRSVITMATCGAKSSMFSPTRKKLHARVLKSDEGLWRYHCATLETTIQAWLCISFFLLSSLSKWIPQSQWTHLAD